MNSQIHCRFPRRRPARTAIATLLALCTLLAACASGVGLGSSSGPPGAEVAQQPGIGGTGDVAGGTPGIGGTGIIGTVTAFGSIFVNGYEIGYPRGFPMSRNGAATSAADLRVGQIVEAEATGEGRKLTARRIAIRHEVLGPVERIDLANGRLVVLGQRISFEPATGAESSGSPLRPENLSIGDMVEVSGLRRGDGSIAASRIDRATADAPALVRGPVGTADANGFTIGGLGIEAAAATRPAGLQPGHEAAVRGIAKDGILRPTIIEAAPLQPFGGRVSRISVEGFLGRTPSGALGIGGVSLTRPAPDSHARPGNRVIMEGALDNRGRMVPSSSAPVDTGGDRPPGDLPQLQHRPNYERSIPALPSREPPRSMRAPPPVNRR